MSISVLFLEEAFCQTPSHPLDHLGKKRISAKMSKQQKSKAKSVSGKHFQFQSLNKIDQVQCITPKSQGNQCHTAEKIYSYLKKAGIKYISIVCFEVPVQSSQNVSQNPRFLQTMASLTSTIGLAILGSRADESIMSITSSLLFPSSFHLHFLLLNETNSLSDKASLLIQNFFYHPTQ